MFLLRIAAEIGHEHDVPGTTKYVPQSSQMFWSPPESICSCFGLSEELKIQTALVKAGISTDVPDRMKEPHSRGLAQPPR